MTFCDGIKEHEFNGLLYCLKISIQTNITKLVFCIKLRRYKGKMHRCNVWNYFSYFKTFELVRKQRSRGTKHICTQKRATNWFI